MSTVRFMEEADLDAVVALQDASFAGAADSSRLSRSDLLQELGRSQSKVWVHSAPALGYLLTWHVADELHVHNVAVHPDARRRGVARALLEEAERYMRAHGVVDAWLEVRRTNLAAVRLYQALGYEVSGERLRYYDDGEDALLMHWSPA